MKKILLISIILSIYPLISFAQYTLTIKLVNLRSNSGQILLTLYDENEQRVTGEYGKIEDSKCTIIINNLKSGNYAFRYYHDENNNDKFDSDWMGMPKEGYGFSNNAKGKFGPPSFENWIFGLNDNLKMICIPSY